MARETLKDSLAGHADGYKLLDNLSSCLGCGKCVGNCPAARQTPSYNPRQIIRDVLNGAEERWLKSEEIWRCLWCAGCYTLCPMDISYPLLIMQLRYRAVEAGYGLQYIAPFKKFAMRAREDGLTFAPGGSKGRERVQGIRSGIGASPWPEISEKAKAEYTALFDLCGVKRDLEGMPEDAAEPLDLNYLGGRIVYEP
ncbi:MAG: 4Fe-4S dicluster domain-containing protein [Desulfovibrionaceae bacterium]|nr:4Fe-4S dicluster domain-containing protein [Desulfovibrionaceae bacterium]